MKKTNDQPGKNRLRRKNTALKQKLKSLGGMLGTSLNVPPEIENQFLQSVLAFETNYKQRRTVTIFDKIGRPAQFKPVKEIPDENMEQTWTSLYDYMYKHGIDLQYCSPNVSPRELYRFSVEELFQMDVEDISLPGMMTCFIYDEFYPDHKYDNEKLAIENGILPILGARHIAKIHFTDPVQFNNEKPLEPEAFSRAIQEFQSRFDEITGIDIRVIQTTLKEFDCQVSGWYRADFLVNEVPRHHSGKWLVHLTFEKEFAFWLIDLVEMQGIELGVRY